MKRYAIVAVIIAAVLSLAFAVPAGKTHRKPCRIACAVIITATQTAMVMTTAPTDAPQLQAAPVNYPDSTCSPDWTLPFTAENTYRILDCLHQHPHETLCPPLSATDWVAFFNTSECWLRNHPEAATATLAVPYP